MSISSTINLPAWGSDLNNEDTVEPFADMRHGTLTGSAVSPVMRMVAAGVSP